MLCISAYQIGYECIGMYKALDGGKDLLVTRVACTENAVVLPVTVANSNNVDRPNASTSTQMKAESTTPS